MRSLGWVVTVVMVLTGCAAQTSARPTGCPHSNGPKVDRGARAYSVISDRVLMVQSAGGSTIDIIGRPTVRETASAISITWPVSPGTLNTEARCGLPAVLITELVEVQLRAPLGTRRVVQAKDGKPVMKMDLLGEGATAVATVTATPG